MAIAILLAMAHSNFLLGAVKSPRNGASQRNRLGSINGFKIKSFPD
jgi:hypothetical protein